MTLPDPSYITAEEVKEQSFITGLKDGSTGLLEDADIETLILAAEDQIDKHVGRQPHHPYDSNLTRVFPREQDYQRVGSASGILEYPQNPEVPYDVSRACLRQVEWLYTQWWANRATTMQPSEHAVEQQSIGSDGSYSETRAHGGTDFTAATLCEQAKTLLSGFVSRMTAISTTDTRTVLPPAGSDACY